jgi:succinate dehydrogenase / fumarate reductase cytochrome b subunit
MITFYRGREGMWAWALHRITGLGVLLFLVLHILDTALMGFGPDAYNHAVNLYRTPLFRLGEIALGAALLYHTLNGLRVIAIDFSDTAARHQRALFYAVIVLFLLLFIPMTAVMLIHWLG